MNLAHRWENCDSLVGSWGQCLAEHEWLERIKIHLGSGSKDESKDGPYMGLTPFWLFKGDRSKGDGGQLVPEKISLVYLGSGNT